MKLGIFGSSVVVYAGSLSVDPAFVVLSAILSLTTHKQGDRSRFSESTEH